MLCAPESAINRPRSQYHTYPKASRSSDQGPWFLADHHSSHIEAIAIALQCTGTPPARLPIAKNISKAWRHILGDQ